MTALQMPEPRWTRPAPTLLPYSQARIHNDAVEWRFDEAAYRDTLRQIATADLLDDLEHSRFLAIELAGAPPSRAYLELRIKGLADELARRQQLIATGDPVAPKWPRKRADIPARIAAVKAAWPVARMVAELLGVQLHRAGQDRLKGLCPLHQENTPSFTVFPKEHRAHCFGCQQGGDVIELAGLYFGHARFLDKLECLERFAGIDGRSASAP